jgi:hypothetical protein
MEEEVVGFRGTMEGFKAAGFWDWVVIEVEL